MANKTKQTKSITFGRAFTSTGFLFLLSLTTVCQLTSNFDNCRVAIRDVCPRKRAIFPWLYFSLTHCNQLLERGSAMLSQAFFQLAIRYGKDRSVDKGVKGVPLVPGPNF